MYIAQAKNWIVAKEENFIKNMGNIPLMTILQKGIDSTVKAKSVFAYRYERECLTRGGNLCQNVSCLKAVIF